MRPMLNIVVKKKTMMRMMMMMAMDGQGLPERSTAASERERLPDAAEGGGGCHGRLAGWMDGWMACSEG